MPIDYSKWDRLDEYSDDSSDEGSNANAGRSDSPRVTRLDAPSKVTFGGGVAATVEPSVGTDYSRNRAQLPVQPVPSPPPAEGKRPKASVGDRTKNPECSVNHHETWTDRGGLVMAQPASPNDDQGIATTTRRLYWSQDRYSVFLRLELHDREQVELVDVPAVVPYTERFSATGSTKPRLVCRGATGTDASANQQCPVVLLEGDLPHPVHLAEEDEDVDWSIVRDGTSTGRFLFITLYKAVPMQGVFVWWRRPLMQFPEVEVDYVKNTDGSSGTSSSSSANQDFVKAWDEAHRMFREKKKDATGRNPTA